MDLDDKIAGLAATLAERERLGPRRAGLSAAIVKLSGELDDLRRRHAGEQRDDVMVARMVATLSGSPGRECPEAVEARQRLTEGHRRLDDLQEQLAELTVRLAATDTAPEAYTAALAEREREMREPEAGAGGRLAELAEEHGLAESELHRLERAAQAVAQATEALREASELLEPAGGHPNSEQLEPAGSHPDSELLDEAAAYLAGAERQLSTARQELGSIGIAPPVSDAGTVVTGLTVRDRITGGRDQACRIRSVLSARTAELRARLRRIEVEREGLLET